MDPNISDKEIMKRFLFDFCIQNLDGLMSLTPRSTVRDLNKIINRWCKTRFFADTTEEAE